VATADAPALSAPAALPPSDPLGGIDLAALPPLGSSAPLGNSANPLGTPIFSTLGSLHASQPVATYAGVSNPSGGPTDMGMRLISGGMLGLGLFLLGMNMVSDALQGAVYLAPVFLGPLMLVLGIAGLVSPNVVRAGGKFGGHLPWHYKAMFYGLLGIWFIIAIVMAISLAASGYRPGP
jgi:hypothetical protein